MWAKKRRRMYRPENHAAPGGRFVPLYCPADPEYRGQWGSYEVLNLDIS
jgi:hypothetical protein